MTACTVLFNGSPKVFLSVSLIVNTILGLYALILKPCNVRLLARNLVLTLILI